MNDVTLAASLSSQFTWIDWAVVVGYLAFTTCLGTVLAGRQASMRDFFLGGRKLPWYAVSGSIIATEISALTFVSVPSVVFKMGVEGNFKYLQLGLIGTFLARVIVGYVLVPAYYKREIYSPYDYMGNQLGGRVRGMTTVLFSLGGILGQSARVYLTAEVVNVVLREQLAWLVANVGLNELAWSLILIGAVSVAWTLIGGITTVIWTDVILFLVFLLGAFVALGTVASYLDGGFAEMCRIGFAAKDCGAWGKFTFFDFDLSPARQYTIWTAAIASTWGGLGAYGTDQLLAQRMFCCKNTRDARWAIISSSVGQVVTLTVMLVGVGLYAYYSQEPATDAPADFLAAEAHPDFPNLRGEALEMYNKKADRIFPIFILERIPRGLKGLIIAAIFAAAISSLMGILTALSQVVMSAFYNPLRERHLRRKGIEVTLGSNVEALTEKGEPTAEDRRSVVVGRLMVLFWGVALCLMAYWAAEVSRHYKSILDLGLAMVGYTGGALLAGFALSFLPLRIDGRGFMFSGPLSVVFVFGLVWHQPWTHVVCWAFAVIIFLVWIWRLITEAQAAAGLPDWNEQRRRVVALIVRDGPQTLILCAGLALMLWLNHFGFWHGEPDADGNPAVVTVAWPWYAPIGSTIAFVWGYLLARRRGPETVDGGWGTKRSAGMNIAHERARAHFRSIGRPAGWGPLCVGALAVFLSGCIGPRGTEPMRAIWVTRFDYKTPADVKRIVDNCADAGFNTVLFQVRGNGTAFYRSNFEPWADELGGEDPGFDPLALACRRAHRRGIELHAYVNVIPGWRGSEPPANPEQLYNKRPEWFWYDQNGDRQKLSGFYVSLNPCLPEVRTYIVDVFHDIVSRYDVDGLHLDYIRFPNEPPAIPRGSGLDYPRDERTLALYQADTGLGPDDDEKAWDRWRTEQVTKLVCEIHNMARRTKPELVLSAAVSSVRARALRHFQDARAWMERGCIDVALLMNYTDDAQQFSDRIDAWLADGLEVPIVPGLWFGRPGERGTEEAARVVEQQVGIATSKTGNFCIFAYSLLFDSADEVLTDQSSAQQRARKIRRDMLLPQLQSLAAGTGR